MNTIFKLTEVRTQSQDAYPYRKLWNNACGYFSSLQQAEEMMHETKRYVPYSGPDTRLAFFIDELKLNAEASNNLQSYRRYNANGELLCEYRQDEEDDLLFLPNIFNHYEFKQGNIVEFLGDGQSILAVLWSDDCSEPTYPSFYKKTEERCKGLTPEVDGEDLPSSHIFSPRPSAPYWVAFTIEDNYRIINASPAEIIPPTKNVSLELQHKAANIIRKEFHLDLTWKTLQLDKELNGKDMAEWMKLLKEEETDVMPFSKDSLLTFQSPDLEISHVSYTFGKGENAFRDCIDATTFGSGLRIVKVWTAPDQSLTIDKFGKVGRFFKEGIEIHIAIGTSYDLMNDEVKLLAISLKKKGEEEEDLGGLPF